MEYNLPSVLVKELNFGSDAKNKIKAGVDKLAEAVKSTLGASGRCVIYEDARGNPVITKDGVTVAESVVLLDPVENLGATLIKEAAKTTVEEAGDGTTTATVLAQSLLNEFYSSKGNVNIRNIKNGLSKGLKKINKYLDKSAVKIEGDMLKSVSSISCNNDAELGKIIAEAYDSVGKDTMPNSFKCLKKHGMLVSFGQSSGMYKDLQMTDLMPKSLYLTRPTLFHFYADKKWLTQSSVLLFEMIESRKINLDQITKYSLEEVAKAHTDIEERNTTGSIILMT